MKSNSEPFIVKYVDFHATRLIDSNNNFYQEINIGKAKQMAKDAGLDLVCFKSPSKGDSSELAFCKIIDYGKWRYSEEKRKKKSQTHKKQTKEIRFSPSISDHDIEHKLKQVEEFLTKGDDVIFSMRLKGRQRFYFDEAEEKMNGIIKMCENYGKELNRRKTKNMINVRMGKC